MSKAADPVAERNKQVSDAADELCKIARLSPTGKHGITFFDTIMGIYLEGEKEALRRLGASVDVRVEDAAQRCAWVANAWAAKGNLPTATNVGSDLLKLAMADEIRKHIALPAAPEEKDNG